MAPPASGDLQQWKRTVIYLAKETAKERKFALFLHYWMHFFLLQPVEPELEALQLSFPFHAAL